MKQKPTKIGQGSFRTGGTARLLLALALAAACAGRAWAQGDVPSGTITGSGSGSSFIYNLTFSDGASATSPIGSIWYSWIPDAFFLPGVPTTASAPSGWAETIEANSIQFFALSSAVDIQPGHSLSGFSFHASFSPTTLANTANSELSDAYAGGIETDAGEIFTVQAVPEPSSMALFGMSALGLVAFGRRKLRARA